MAKNSTKTTKRKSKKQAAMKRFIRSQGAKFLEDHNVTSIGIGKKNGDGVISLVFTVADKQPASALESLGTKLLPEQIEFEGFKIQTDVLQREFKPSYSIIQSIASDDRRSRLDPFYPGASVAHFKGTAGTVGGIVYESDTGAPCILSNWHVLHGNKGAVGEKIVQPGPFDDNDVDSNSCGELLRSHLGPAGDCAISRIRDRGFLREIHELDVTPTEIAEVDLDDPVVKSGRTTGVTYGLVRRTDVMVRIDYGAPTGNMSIGCFEIGLDPSQAPPDGEISRPGDSGAFWLIAKKDKATNIFAGLHFAGEASTNTDEHALACYPNSVRKKLRFDLSPPAHLAVAGEDVSAVLRTGFDERFLGQKVPLPTMSTSLKRDAVNFGRKQLIPYTHFSVCLSAKRRMARFVAWNIDGAQKVVLGDHGFKTDKRVDEQHQLDNSLYADNKLDRGHVARRADLAWGPIEEAKQANKDSFFYTNIVPQHERFNRSNKSGLWGKLENIILEDVATQDIKVSVFAGPIFGDRDPEYRGALIPREYWKLIAYTSPDGELRCSCFMLSQSDLLQDIETIDFDPFRLFQISAEELTERTGLDFAFYHEIDSFVSSTQFEVLERAENESPRASQREITSASDLVF